MKQEKENDGRISANQAGTHTHHILPIPWITPRRHPPLPWCGLNEPDRGCTPPAPRSLPGAQTAPSHLHELVLVEAEVLGAPRQVHLPGLHEGPRLETAPQPGSEAQHDNRNQLPAQRLIRPAARTGRARRAAGEARHRPPPRQRPLQRSERHCRRGRAAQNGGVGVSVLLILRAGSPRAGSPRPDPRGFISLEVEFLLPFLVTCAPGSKTSFSLHVQPFQFVPMCS